jgi:hypothetical protein
MRVPRKSYLQLSVPRKGNGWEIPRQKTTTGKLTSVPGRRASVEMLRSRSARIDRIKAKLQTCIR